MATTLTTPGQLAAQVDEIARALGAEARALRNEEQLWLAMLAQGVAPLTVKTRMDDLLAGHKAVFQRFGNELGHENTAVAPLLPDKFATQWRPGAPPGVSWFTIGASNSRAFYWSGNAAQGLRLINYFDGSPNYDIFAGLKANDVIHVENCIKRANNGRRVVAMDVAAKGASLNNPAAVATYGPNDSGDTFWDGNFRNAAGTGWTAETDWAIGSGVATYSTDTGTTARALTHVLAGMTAGAAYQIQFDLTVSGTDPVGSLAVYINDEFYWAIEPDATAAAQTYSFVTNALSATPTLTFIATRANGIFTLTIDNVIVSGYQGLVLFDPFDTESTEDDEVSITLEQTAA